MNPPPPDINAKLYIRDAESHMSMHDLLEVFNERGHRRITDLHLTIGNPPMYRVDGRIKAFLGAPLDRPTIEALARTFLKEEEFARLATQHSVDASFADGDKLFRANCFHENEGLAIALRSLEPTPLPVDQVGFPNLAWSDIVARGFGLVLVVGTTGSGKSTTVAALLNHIAQTQPYRMITLEDPIEYRFKSDSSLISQRQLGRHVDSFENGLRDALREDPDVIFVGEMRDRESARWTLTAAETGHLVFSTLHTRDTVGTITRLLDMFPANQQDEIANQLSLGLAWVVCQRLVPRADRQGRVVAMEIMNNSYALAHLIRTRKTEQIYTLLQTRTKDEPGERMVTMEQSLAKLVAAGIVEEQEAEQWANQPSEFANALRYLRGVK